MQPQYPEQVSNETLELQTLAHDPDDTFPGIESTPGVCGGAACIVRTRIPVWGLVQARRLGTSEADLLRWYPTLRAEDLANAWAYFRAHREEIEQQIRLHNQGTDHSGIIVCTIDPDDVALTQRIHQKIVAHAGCSRQLIRIYRPSH